MTTITFKGVPGEQHDAIQMYGLRLPLGRAVDASKLSQAELRKLKNHPHFGVDDDIEDVTVKGETKYAAKEDLLQLAREFGVQVDGRWSDGRLAAEVEKAAKAK